MAETRAAGAPLRVGHSFPEWLPLTQTWMYNLVRYLPSDEIESHVLCEITANLDRFGVPHLHSAEREPGLVRLWDRGLRWTGLRRHDGFLVRAGRRAGVRLLHSHFGNIGWLDIGAARRLGARHVVTFYGFDVSRLPQEDPRWRARFAELFRGVDAVLCEGSHMGRSVAALGCDPAKIHVHHLGVRTDEIEYRPRVRAPGEPLRVLIAASFREKKGIPDAIAALGRVRGEIPVELTIIGDAGSEAASRAEKSRILAALAEQGLESRTRLLGYQPHDVLFREAYAHHVFLSPSVTASDGDTEGGAPVSLIDMAASGMPIVSTTHCDIPEIVLHERTGLLAAERDVPALAAHLRRLAAHPESWAPMVEAGRRHVEREYDAREQGRRLAALYRRIVGT